MTCPDWEDVGTVYDRMQARRMFTRRAKPGGVIGHLFSMAVFARAERRLDSDFDPVQFTEEYAEFKKIDLCDLVDAINEELEIECFFEVDLYAMLEVLSEP